MRHSAWLWVLGFVLVSSASEAHEVKGPRVGVMTFAEFKRSELGTVVAKRGDDCDATCTERKQELRYVVYVGKEIYCYWDEKKAETGTDFDQLAQELEKSITSQTTYSAYYNVLRKWASAFHDGHVNAMATADLTRLEIYTSPLRLEVMAPATDHEKVIITQITANAGVEGAAVGDQVIEVGGVPVADAITKAVGENTSGSTERMRRFAAARRLVDVTGLEQGALPLVLKILPFAGGDAKTITVPRTVQLDVTPGAAAPADTGAALFTAKILPGGWGYFRLDGFSGTQDERLISQAMDRLAATPGLILDLRKNGGGDLSGDRIIERLATKEVIRYKRSERMSDFVLSRRTADMFSLIPDATGTFSIWHDLTVKPVAEKHYAKPVVALISPYCFSACDTFSASLKGNQLATFIGEPTGGGTGTPLVFDLPVSPLQFRYSVIRGQEPDGSLIEGKGTQPDIYLEPTVEDRAKGKDSQLVKAIEVLQKALGQEPAPIPHNLGVAPVWTQSLDRSPTVEELDTIRSLAGADERGG